MNSDNGGGEVKKDEAKRKKERNKEWGAKISAPTLKAQPKLSQP